jgi:hypothetical protein
VTAPPNDWYNPLRGGLCEYYCNFADKGQVVWLPSAPWTSRDITYDSYLIQDDLTNAGPLPPVDFLKTVRFKRDYVGKELNELQQRELEAPEYEIQMLTSE